MCSIIGVGERLHKVLGQIDVGRLDSGEQSFNGCPLGYLFGYNFKFRNVPLDYIKWTCVVIKQ